MDQYLIINIIVFFYKGVLLVWLKYGHKLIILQFRKKWNYNNHKNYA